MNYDVIIVGGGPAGSTAAFCLQRARKRCLIVEQKTSIGEKTCGGLLTWSGIQALEAAGLPSRELLHMGAVPIHQFVYFQNHETTSHCYHGGEYGLGLTRRLLDQWLLDYALAAGAVLKAGTRFRTVVRRRDGFFQVGEDSAPRLIIATGASGLIPHNAGPLLKKQTFGLSAQITGKTALAPDAVFFYMLGENGPDYFWIIPNAPDFGTSESGSNTLPQMLPHSFGGIKPDSWTALLMKSPLSGPFGAHFAEIWICPALSRKTAMPLEMPQV